MILTKSGWLFLSIFMLSGCNDQGAVLLDDLSGLKKRFIAEVLEGAVDECPFDMSYNLRTVFYSKELISLFGGFHKYTHLPHGSAKYEGRTFYKKNGKFIQLVLNDLITNRQGWEFIRKYCENVFKNDPCTYFSGDEPLRTKLELQELNTFTLDEQAIILVFQPYTVAGGMDGPPIVRISWNDLLGFIEQTHPLRAILSEILSSKCFVSSWDQKNLSE
jgi:hypothetical protein